MESTPKSDRGADPIVTVGIIRPRSRRLPSKAWNQFLDDLVVADEADGLPLESEHAQGFNGVVIALAAVINLLKSAGEFDRLGKPFLTLTEGLADLSNGSVPPVFERAPVKRRPTKTAADANLMGIAARAMDCLMRAGDRRDLAAKKVAKAVRATGHPGTEDCTDNRVAGWRDRLREGPDSATKLALARWHAPLPAFVPDDPGVQARFLLEQLAEKFRKSPPLNQNGKL